MELNQLEIFVNVINNKSFTKTAKQLFITQPTVSAHVAALERELNTQLVIRTTKEVSPSPQGEILYRYATQMLHLRDSAFQSIQGQNIMEGCISIGASTIPSQYFLPELMAAFSAKYEKISFQVSTMDSACVLEELSDCKIDIGFCGMQLPSNKCIFTPLAVDRLVVITPNTQPYQSLKGQCFSIRQLEKEPLITRESGSGTRRTAEMFLEENGVSIPSLNVVAEIEDTESIKKSVSQGLGISIVSDQSVKDYCEFGKILSFDLEPAFPPRMLYILCHKARHFSPAAKAFFDFARTYFPK